MATIGTIASTLMGFASGGWGSFAAILALIGAAAFLYWKYKKALQEKAKNDGADAAVVDQGQMIADNQDQSGQIAIDDKQNEDALAQAMKKLEATSEAPRAPAERTP